ncbi:hypothetical protein TNCV_4475111 [Trichonephila clavipes]|nr:hypothetical protein TNCV_4475111 [Trichonephila clavipes]
MCSLLDVVLPTGVIDEDETGQMDRGGEWDDVIKTVAANSTLFQATHLVSFSMSDLVVPDFDDVKEMNNATPVPTSSEMRDAMKCMRSYLDAHSNVEMNNRMYDTEQFVDSWML